MVLGYMEAAADKTRRELGTVRDTVESIWIAVVLAFVLRAFMFEAFVIPTGSMAPRLVGEHWDLVCPCCGMEYAYGLHGLRGHGRFRRGNQYVPEGARCPHCGYPFAATRQKGYVNSGDRVLVLKYIYNFTDPRPWDVVVFRNPQNNEENYIKRLIGLPGETIEIINGDVYYRRGDGQWKIRRKERKKTQDAMWQIVFDNDYRPNMEMIRRYNLAQPPAKQVHPPKWMAASVGASHWNLDASAGRRFVFDGCDKPCELLFKADRTVFEPRYGYNPNGNGKSNRSDVDVCGDLNLSLTFVPKDRDACVSLVLTNMHHRFRAEVRADGECTLYYKHPAADGGRETVWQRGNVGTLKTGRGCGISLEHVDQRVTLHVGGRMALQSTDSQYSPSPVRLKAHLWKLKSRLEDLNRRRDAANESGGMWHESADSHVTALAVKRRELLEEMLPAPKAGILAHGGRCDLAHVRLARDVYYTYQRLQEPNKGDRDILLDYARSLGKMPGQPGSGVIGNPITLRKHPDNPELDEFFVLGDNSPQSLDGRAWIAAAPTLRLRDENGRPLYTLGTVPRYSMIGRALFVYWPGGFRIPELPGLPIIPNVGRMRLIR